MSCEDRVRGLPHMKYQKSSAPSPYPPNFISGRKISGQQLVQITGDFFFDFVFEGRDQKAEF